jgi:hypothetical protein
VFGDQDVTRSLERADWSVRLEVDLSDLVEPVFLDGEVRRVNDSKGGKM